MDDQRIVSEAYEAGRKDGIDEERAAVVRYLEHVDRVAGGKAIVSAHGLADDIEAGQHAARGAQGNTGEVE